MYSAVKVDTVSTLTLIGFQFNKGKRGTTSSSSSSPAFASTSKAKRPRLIDDAYSTHSLSLLNSRPNCYETIDSRCTMSTPNAHPLALPAAFSPDDLDPLTELAVVLAKVRAHIQASNGIAPGATPGGPSSGGQQLSFKDVPGATDALKHKLQRARAQVAALPDMDRSAADQRVEISELEARIASQTALLERLREGGVRFGKEDGVSGEKMES